MPPEASFADRPKAELHLHLEGAVPLPTMRELVAKHAPRSRVDAITQTLHRVPVSGFESFLAAWRRRAVYMRDYDDFELMAASVAAELRRSNVVYAEVHVSPHAFARRFGLDVGSLLLAVRRGFDRHAAGAPVVRLIVDLVRHYGADVARKVLGAVAEVAAEARVVAVGLGGIEHACSAAPYADVFRRAERLGFHRVAHAGEHADAPSVWDVTRMLNVERVGHAVSAHRDERLMDHLRDARIAVEVCLSSNLHTGAVRELSDHPLSRLVRHGIPVALATDDPALFDTDLNSEYQLALDQGGLTRDELRACARAAFEVAFVSGAERQHMLDSFDRAWS
jgi:adenosine deaminase